MLQLCYNYNTRYTIHQITGRILHYCRLKQQIIESVFPDILNNYLDYNWLSTRTILAAKNVDFDEINFQIRCKVIERSKIKVDK